MKTDLVEIFQTLRASLFSYQTRGYAVHENSDNAYELFSEKNRKQNGERISNFFFAGLYIENGRVALKFNATELDFENKNLIKFENNIAGVLITQLDQQMKDEFATYIEIVHAHFKKKEWV